MALTLDPHLSLFLQILQPGVHRLFVPIEWHFTDVLKDKYKLLFYFKTECSDVKDSKHSNQRFILTRCKKNYATGGVSQQTLKVYKKQTHHQEKHSANAVYATVRLLKIRIR